MARHSLFALPALLALAACAKPGPQLTGGSFPERARELLQSEARSGPVALVNRVEGTSSQALADAAEDGVRGLSVRFDPDLPVDSRFRLVVAQEAGDPCRSEGALSNSLITAFCRGDEAVASAAIDLNDEIDVEDAVRRAARQIFPDLYAEQRRGGIFGSVGSGVSIGGGVTFGF